MLRNAFSLLLLCAAAPAFAAADMSGAAQIDDALAGKTAGAAQNCINTFRKDMPTSLAPDRILFRYNSSRVYLNEPKGGCPGLRKDRAIVRVSPSDRLCKGDIVQVIDPSVNSNLGSCTLGEFVPFEKGR